VQSTFADLRNDANLARSIPYFLTGPEAIGGPPVEAVHWPADPAEPRVCLNADWARKLSDFSSLIFWQCFLACKFPGMWVVAHIG
jgi:hypothetical protein